MTIEGERMRGEMIAALKARRLAERRIATAPPIAPWLPTFAANGPTVHAPPPSVSGFRKRWRGSGARGRPTSIRTNTAVIVQRHDCWRRLTNCPRGSGPPVPLPTGIYRRARCPQREEPWRSFSLTDAGGGDL